MSTSDQQLPPGPPTPPGPPAPGSVGPTAPVPPRSRAADHLLGVLVGVLGSLLAFAVLGAAINLGGFRPEVDPAGLLAALVAGAVLAGIACWNGRSATAAAVAGAIWSIAGLLGLHQTFGNDLALIDLPPEIGGRALGSGLWTLTFSGVTLAVGATFLGLAAASSIARRRGRAWERSEQSLRAQGAVATPPSPRIVSHLAAIVISVALSLVTVVLLDSVVVRRLARLEDLGRNDLLVAVAIVVVGAAGVALTGAMSSLGPAAGAVVWLAVGVSSALAPTSSGALVDALHRLLQDVLDLPPSGNLAFSTSAPWALALLLLGGAAGTHFARRGGRSIQRQEQLFIESQDAAWSDPRG